MYSIEDKSNRYQILWDLGRRCSYACTYCPPHRNNKTSAFVNYETLCKSMDGVAEYALLYDSFRKKPAKKKNIPEKIAISGIMPCCRLFCISVKYENLPFFIK